MKHRAIITHRLRRIFAALLLTMGVRCGDFPEWDSMQTALYGVLLTFRITSVTPADGATRQGIATTNIVISFSRAVDPGSITVNSSSQACSGSVQISADNFGTCLTVGNVSYSPGNQSVTISPAVAFPSPATIRLRVQASAASSAGQSLGQDFNAAFTTSTLTFQTTAIFTGALGGVTGADVKCMADTAYPGTGTFKAMVVDGVNRSACVTTGCNWVFQPSRNYYRPDGSTLILTTNAQGVTGGGLTGSFTGTGAAYWTGLDTAWGADINDCANWADGTVASNGTFGVGNSTAAAGYSGGNVSCNVSRPLICVQQ